MLGRIRQRGGLVPAAWLVADAGLAALLAGPAEVLLLYVLSPDRPLTLRDSLATLLALMPQILVLFVILGPALAIAGMAFAVGRTTQRGLSMRYVLRFALLDAVLLSLTATRQLFDLGEFLPGRGQSALMLMVIALTGTAILLGVLFVRDLVRPRRVEGPWLVAIALGLALALAAAAEIRRVRQSPLTPIVLPGVTSGRALLLIEIPGLSSADERHYAEAGIVPAFEALSRDGITARVQARPGIAGSVALHASLLTGKDVRDHGLFGAVRYRPLGDRRSFAVLPRGLFLRPLLNTPLWSRVPVDHDALRSAALPSIAQSMSLRSAFLGDPLDWPPPTPDSWALPDRLLRPGARVTLPGRASALVCPDPGDAARIFFEPVSADLEETGALADVARHALSRDLCALEAARAALMADEPFDIVAVRLSGYYEVAYVFAGWRQGQSARGASELEIAAWGRTLPRYAARLAPALRAVLEGASEGSIRIVVSPHGIEARTGLDRLREVLMGVSWPTGTHAGPPSGVLTAAGPGLRRGESVAGAVPLTSVLPTLLGLLSLPVAEDMDRRDLRLLDEEAAARRPLFLDSYARTEPSGRTTGAMVGSK